MQNMKRQSLQLRVSNKTGQLKLIPVPRKHCSNSSLLCPRSVTREISGARRQAQNLSVVTTSLHRLSFARSKFCGRPTTSYAELTFGCGDATSKSIAQTIPLQRPVPPQRHQILAHLQPQPHCRQTLTRMAPTPTSQGDEVTEEPLEDGTEEVIEDDAELVRLGSFHLTSNPLSPATRSIL